MLKNPTIYVNRTTDIPYKREIRGEIVGFLKFSDFGITNGISHFDALKQGKVFFAPLSVYDDLSLTDAQRAIEGSTKFTMLSSGVDAFLPRINIKMSDGKNYSIQTPKKAVFRPLGKLEFSYGDWFDQTTIHPKILRKYLSQFLSTPDFDFAITPNRYIKRKNIIQDDGEFLNFEFDKFKITFSNFNAASTWRISCFTAVYRNNINDEGRLSTAFLETLFSDFGNGSIALDSNGNCRPWIYISSDDLYQELNKFDDVEFGSVHYYNNHNKPYSYTFNDVISNPHLLLLEKDDDYETQQEFRIIFGGPNDSFEGLANPIVRFTFENIRFGETKNELQDLILGR